jgi:hypothetical protein
VGLRGDVVATRRNDRQSVTSTGQPVRNRDTWTITDVHADGSATVSHRGGHGEVTLPATYLREHVRLGYAATEHGWQSDTVTTAAALISPATTRRGLYVAATRGTDDNRICVITDSTDVAEARDVLEGVLAVDRADTPAVTQRHALAEQHHGHVEPADTRLTPRCAIPDWFAPLMARAERDRGDAEARDEARATCRDQATAAVAAAERTLSEVAAATTPDRDAYRQAAARAARARQRHAAAQRRLDTAGWRQRRSLRSDVEIARRQLERAEDYLEHTRHRTTPSVERHREALITHRDAHDHLRTCDTIDLLDTMLPTADDHCRHLRALNTWRRWAQGHDVPLDKLCEAVETLTNPPGDEPTPTRRLADDVRYWAADHGLAVPDCFDPLAVTCEHGLSVEF